MEVTVKLTKADLKYRPFSEVCYLLPCIICPYFIPTNCSKKLKALIRKEGLIIESYGDKYTFLKPEE
jgi:hypothetical protein